MRRRVAALAAMLAPLLFATGCLTSGGQSADEGSKTIRVSWFGNDVRSKRIEEAVKAFEAANPGLKVESEFTGFANYFDKLATQFAANDAPDVVMLGEQHIGEYAGRGALMELGDSIDTSGFDESAAATGTTKEGRYGIAAGLNAMAILANPTIFKQAGVALPNDETWTWDEYAQVAAKVTASGKKGIFGSGAPNFGPALELWLRQHGKSMYTEDGKLGFTAEDATAYLTYIKGLGTTKAIPPGSVIVEDDKSLEQSTVATNRGALGWFFSSAIAAVNKASGQQMTILQPPRTGESPALYVRADSLWSVNAKTKNAENAKKLISFLVNDPGAGEALRTSVGVPPNAEVRKAVSAKLEKSEAIAVTYLDEISDQLGPERPAIPAGGGVLDATLKRLALDVLFGRAEPKAAAEKLVSELDSAIKQ